MPDEWDVAPLLSRRVAQGGVADAAGNVNIDPNVEGVGSSIDARIVDFIHYGILNGSFSRGPFDPTANLDPIDNPLPDWYGPVQVSGGSLTAQWVTDTTAPSGHSLTLTIPAGASGDEGYVQQVIPIGGMRRGWQNDEINISAYAGSANTDTFRLVFSTQYLDTTGAALGSPFEYTYDLAASGVLTYDTGAPPASPTVSTAQYLRLRVGMRRFGAASASGTITFSDIRRIAAVGEVILSDNAAPATYSPGFLRQSSGLLELSATGSGGTPSGKLQLSTASAILLSPTPGIGILVDTVSNKVYGQLDVTTTGQIVFPATDNPSANANTLDDYQETSGTNLTCTFGGLAVSLTQTNAYRAIKIGSRVWIAFTMTFTAKGSSTGTFLISGLPFTSENTTATGGGIIQQYTNMSGVAGINVRVVPNSTTANLYFNAATTTTLLADTNFTNTSTLNGSFFYNV